MKTILLNSSVSHPTPFGTRFCNSIFQSLSTNIFAVFKIKEIGGMLKLILICWFYIDVTRGISTILLNRNFISNMCHDKQLNIL